MGGGDTRHAHQFFQCTVSEKKNKKQKTILTAFITYLSLGPPHSLKHLLAKFGVIITPSAVPGVDRPLKLPTS